MAVLKDSGDRTSFGSGAVRDIGEGKGRFDLFPLSILSTFSQRNGNTLISNITRSIDKFLYTLDTIHLYDAIDKFLVLRRWSHEEMYIEVSKHFEDGAVKYGFHNWEKGINISSYISSGVRHLLQYCMKDTTDPHDRAFCWNMICAIWTTENRPECIDTPYHDYDVPQYAEIRGNTASQCEGQLQIDNCAPSGELSSTSSNCKHHSYADIT